MNAVPHSGPVMRKVFSWHGVIISFLPSNLWLSYTNRKEFIVQIRVGRHHNVKYKFTANVTQYVCLPNISKPQLVHKRLTQMFEGNVCHLYDVSNNAFSRKSCVCIVISVSFILSILIESVISHHRFMWWIYSQQTTNLYLKQRWQENWCMSPRAPFTNMVQL